METSPPLVFVNTLLLSPLRVAGIILVSAFGLGAPFVVASGFDQHYLSSLLLYIPLTPIILPVMTLMSGWWGIIAFPLVCIIFTKMFLYLKQDADRYDILQIFVASAFVSLPALEEKTFLAILLLLPVLLYTYKPIRDRVHGNTVEYRPPNEPWMDRYLQLDSAQEVKIEADQYDDFEEALISDDWQQKASAWLIDKKIFRFVRQDEELILVHYQNGEYGLCGYSGAVGYLLALIENVDEEGNAQQLNVDTIRVIQQDGS